MDFFTSVGEEILPPGDWPMGEEGEGSENKNVRNLIDPRRIDFMMKLPDVLFGFTTMNKGFRGYYGFVLKDMLVLENPETGNAVYLLRFEEPIQVDQNIFKLPPEQRVDEDARKKILERVWAPIAGATKLKSLDLGAVRMKHPNISNKEWESRMKEKIEALREKS